jgi:hypothetical protein
VGRFAFDASPGVAADTRSYVELEATASATPDGELVSLSYGRHRKITKREAVTEPLFNKSASVYARPLHDPGNHRSIERGSDFEAAAVAA